MHVIKLKFISWLNKVKPTFRIFILCLSGFIIPLLFCILIWEGTNIQQEITVESLDDTEIDSLDYDYPGELNIWKPKAYLTARRKFPALLTLFTTFRPLDHRFRIHVNVIRNWAQFQDEVRMILYTDPNTDPRLMHIARIHGWIVVPAPRLSPDNLPFFKEMYQDAKGRVNSTFYGFCNADILFNNGLINTLRFIQTSLKKLGQTLVIGIRNNFPVGPRNIFTLPIIDIIAEFESEPFFPYAEDYFIMANGEFPWQQIPDLVVGRRAYDNYVVAMAITNNVSVVDASLSITALHQTGEDGNMAGHKGIGSTWNVDLIGEYKWDAGYIYKAQYKTRYNELGRVEFFSASAEVFSQSSVSIFIVMTSIYVVHYAMLCQNL